MRGISLSLGPAAQLETPKLEVPATHSNNKAKGLGPKITLHMNQNRESEDTVKHMRPRSEVE